MLCLWFPFSIELPINNLIYLKPSKHVNYEYISIGAVTIVFQYLQNIETAL